MTKSQNKIAKALMEIGCYAKSIEWEPIGISFEMQGRSGGWLINGESIGLNIDQALNFIREHPGYFQERLSDG